MMLTRLFQRVARAAARRRNILMLGNIEVPHTVYKQSISGKHLCGIYILNFPSDVTEEDLSVNHLLLCEAGSVRDERR